MWAFEKGGGALVSAQTGTVELCFWPSGSYPSHIFQLPNNIHHPGTVHLTHKQSCPPLPRTLVRPLVGVGAKVGNPAQTVALVERNKGNVPPLLRNGRRTPVLVVLLDRRELEARHRPGDPSLGSGRCVRRPRVDLWQYKCLWSYMQRPDSQPVLPRAVDRVWASVDDGKAAPRLAPKLLAPRRDQ